MTYNQIRNCNDVAQLQQFHKDLRFKLDGWSRPRTTLILQGKWYAVQTRLITLNKASEVQA